jgi:predicted AAA+ superfamily ATPase
MRDFERRQRLLESNPWWREAEGWTQRDPDLREARLNALRFYDPRPLDNIQPGSLYLLMGPRRAGKSVAMKRAIERLLGDRSLDPRCVVFCPCENLAVQDLRRIVKLAEDLAPGVEPESRYWLFDEITYVSGWATALKQLRDQTALRSGCVVATGSSGAKLRDTQGELGGREGEAGGVRLLLPMGFRAFARELYPGLAANLPGEGIALGDLQSEAMRRQLEPLAVYLDEIALAWERYLSIGGFPRAVADALGQVDVQSGTANGLWNVLAGDVLHVGSMSDRDVKALLQRLVAGMGSPLNVAGIAKSLNIGARNTVDSRIDRLCASFYAWRAATTHDGMAVAHAAQSKLYFIDPLIARMPSLRDRSIAPPDVSCLSEQQLGVCLLRGIARTDHLAILDEAALLARRNPKTGSEIDFVGPLLQTPIESKYVSQKWRKERKALDEHYGRGIVATRDILDLGEDIWAVPAGLLVWMVEP